MTNANPTESNKKFLIIGILLSLFVLIPLCVILIVVGLIAINPAGLLKGSPTAVVQTEIPVTTTDAVMPSVDLQARTFTSSGGFSFQYPGELSVFESTAKSESPIVDNPGEYQQIHMELGDNMYLLNIVYSNSVSPIDMPLYGGAAGEFVSRGTIDFLGEPLEKFDLVWEGRVIQVLYAQANPIPRGDFTFGIILVPTDYNLEGRIPAEIIQEVDTILESFVFD